ncbi:hypothetical protein ON010_g13447 [Phytophthora cinnamomi]|nr:hypothetical protein ON010_g13447 [Phytophthora cinnamomi]
MERHPRAQAPRLTPLLIRATWRHTLGCTVRHASQLGDGYGTAGPAAGGAGLRPHRGHRPRALHQVPAGEQPRALGGQRLPGLGAAAAVLAGHLE